ncbi:MAG: hypothetical protein ABIJ00_07575 [Candidatus Eisenbacteria bacterium]
MLMTTGPWVWIAGLLTLAIYSFLYKDNPFYKVAEYIFVGLSAGYWAVFLWWNYAYPNLFVPLGEGNYWNIIPIVLGFMMFTQLSKRTSWLVRFPLTFVLGVSLGLQVIAAVEGDMVPQLQGTFSPFAKGALFNTYNFWTSIGLIVLLVGVLATITYFFFSREHKGVLGVTSKIGVYFLMVAFGASFGYTVMARISLLFGRLHFLLTDWMHLLK